MGGGWAGGPAAVLRQVAAAVMAAGGPGAHRARSPAANCALLCPRNRNRGQHAAGQPPHLFEEDLAAQALQRRSRCLGREFPR
jgi:hypothetical protein